VPAISTKNNDCRPWLNVCVNKKQVCLLIDTGSSVSLLNSSIFVPENAHFCELVGVGGRKLNCSGCLNALIENKGLEKRWMFHVVDLPVDGILGVDFCNEMGWFLATEHGDKVVSQDCVFPNEPKQLLAAVDVKNDMNPLLVDSVKDLPEERRDQMFQLLQKYSDVFTRNKFSPGKAVGVEHHIILEDTRPIRQAPYRVAPAKRNEIQALVEEMLDLGVIEPSNSPWSSPVVLVKKSDGSSRFCVDYRRVNAATRKDTYPLPNPQDLLSSLGNANWFCTLDLQSGYWQIPMSQRDCDKTSFVVPGGSYKFRVMPFGLCNAVATFQRYMDEILKEMSGYKVAVYVDDVIVAGTTLEEMFSALDKMFSILAKRRLFVKLKKCCWLQREVKFLGHCLSKGQLSVDPEKVRVVKEWPEPKCRRQIRAFLGFAGYYRRFVSNFSSIVRPLNKLTSDKTPFQFGIEEKKSFNELKAALSNAPILSTPIENAPLILDVDASYEGLGAVLSQKDENGVERVLEYYSRSLSLSEKNYCITRLELLSLVVAAKHFHHYLVGTPCLVRTDHSALTYLKSFRRIEGQLARWIESLQNYQLNIEYRPGRIHDNADALSRVNCKNSCPCNQGDPQIVMAISSSTNDLKDEQRKDPSIAWIVDCIERDVKPDWCDVSGKNFDCRSLFTQWESLIVVNSVLYRKCLVDGKEIHQLVIPESHRALILEDLHGKNIHVGINRTAQLCKARFYWPGWREDLKNYVLSCIVCRRVSGPANRKKQALASYSSGDPFARIEMDHFGPLPVSGNNNRFVLVIIDCFTKWVECIPVPDTEAKTTANALITHWISRFGTPCELHTDQGRGFESNLIAEMSSTLGIYKTRTTPYHPQSDGIAERFMRFLKDSIQKFLIGGTSTSNWENTLPWVLLSYRASEHSVTGYSPAKCLFGKELSLPIDLLYGCPNENSFSPNHYVQELKYTLHTVHSNVRKHIKTAQENTGKYMGRAPPVKELVPGQKVLVLDPSRKVGISPKIQSKWKGPAEVLSRISMWVYRIRWKGKTFVRHRDHLCPLPVRNI